MAEAALRGSIGSVAVLMRVLRGRVFWSVLDTLFLTPDYDPEAPGTLLRVTERYKIRHRRRQVAARSLVPARVEYRRGDLVSAAAGHGEGQAAGRRPQAGMLTTLTGGGPLSKETAVKSLTILRTCLRS
jgi:hypothetical protein